MTSPVEREYPDDSAQNLIGSWWVQTEEKDLRRGRLVWVIVPYVGNEVMLLAPEGREDPHDHTRALYRVEAYRNGQPDEKLSLPVAALVCRKEERRIIHKAKTRPALVVCCGGSEIEKALRRGAASYQTSNTILLAPYFGADPSAKRGGWKPEFVKRIRACEYPQYSWDQLPVSRDGVESVLRLDHIFPVGRVEGNYEITEFVLSENALQAIDHQLEWLLTGSLEPDTPFADTRAFLLELEGEAGSTG